MGFIQNIAGEINLLALNATIKTISSAVDRMSQAVGTTKEAALVLTL